MKGSLRLTPGHLTLPFSYLASLPPKNSSEYSKCFIPSSSQVSPLGVPSAFLDR